MPLITDGMLSIILIGIETLCVSEEVEFCFPDTKGDKIENLLNREPESSSIFPLQFPLYLENKSLLSRLDFSSAPCHAPSAPSIMPASFLFTSRWISDRSVVAWWAERIEESA
jgi:hypothetical protein